MGAADKVMPHQRVLRVKSIGVNTVESVAAEVIVAVACGSVEIALPHSGVLKRLYHFYLVIFLDLVYLSELIRTKAHRLFGSFKDFFIYIKKFQILTLYNRIVLAPAAVLGKSEVFVELNIIVFGSVEVNRLVLTYKDICYVLDQA